MIHAVIPWLPPSSNNAYSTIRGTNKRVLTTEGKSYKARTTAHLAQKYPKEMAFFRPNVPYLVVVRFWFETILNKGFFTAKKTADSRYKKMDVSNRLKLFEDALKDAAGIDDSQNITLILQKYQGEEKTELWVWDIEAEGTPFDNAFASL